ncbi:MAG: hypothetical protein QHH26_04855 [Armatimonadota bacterium]|nr:hypothetical protein [Armatimonadota bacterium]
MSESTNRKVCPYCQANNFLSSEICWRCGRPLPPQEGQLEQPKTPPPIAQPQMNQATPPPAQQYPQYPSSQPSGGTSGLIIGGFILAALSFMCCPLFLLGAVSIVLGSVAYGRGDRMGIWVIVAGALGMLFGAMAFGLTIRSLSDVFSQARAWPCPRMD